MGAKERLETAHRLLGISNTLSRVLDAIWNGWTKVRVTDAEMKKLIALALMPQKETAKDMKAEDWEQLSAYARRTCEDAYAYAMSHPTQQMDTTKGTLFGAYNAVTGYFGNIRPYKNGEAKLRSLLLGGTAQEKSQKAFNLCLEVAQRGASLLN